MKVLLDTNVVLDVLLEREPFVAAAAGLLARAEGGNVVGWVGATTVTTIHYLATKVVGAARARAAITSLLSILRVAPVTHSEIEAALASPLVDFEDAVLLAAARACGAHAIVTRDPRDFAASGLPVYDPRELLAILRSEEATRR